ncbi:hypothetical protein [Traorella massiliensis]|uniref:hypothetical protein n=1 Tax=Traorella massiliensis TaxID=1903263 RepID=UPI0008F8D7E3|nr:hypothetical protein [Traorella massiliensis]
MAQKNQPNVSGFSIYKDRHGRDVYYDFITKNGYLILESNVSQFNFYQKRLIIPLIAFALLLNYRIGSFYIDIYMATAVAIIVLLAFEFFFRFRFLKSLTVIPNFKPERKTSYLEQINEKNEKSSLFLKAILYILFGVLLAIYSYQKELNDIEFITMLIISLVICIYGIIYLVALAKRKK